MTRLPSFTPPARQPEAPEPAPQPRPAGTAVDADLDAIVRAAGVSAYYDVEAAGAWA